MMDVNACWEQHTYYDASMEATRLRTFLDAMQEPWPWAAHLTRGVDVLTACCARTDALAHIYHKTKHQH